MKRTYKFRAWVEGNEMVMVSWIQFEPDSPLSKPCIIDERNDWERKPTVITTNLDITEIAQIDTRIASRLCNGYIFNLNELTTDYRQKIKKKGI